MLLLENKRKNGSLHTIHFVGIGGIGMSGIAEIMHNLGYKIQGSDIAKNSNTERLEHKGIKIFIGHESDNIKKNVSYVVVSSAINYDNPEIQEAIKLKIPVIKRSEMLAELMRLKCCVAVSGSHGKTTTTSLVACMFESAGLSPTVINGGIINNRSTNAYLGSGDYLIAEADESDATFIKIPSTIGIITNIDPEHLDYYKSFDNLIAAFKTFITNLPFYGFAVLCYDHPIVRSIASDVKERKIITYGIESEDANVVAYNISSEIGFSSFDVKIRLPNSDEVRIIEDIVIPTPGKHNVLNSLAAISVAAELGFDARTIKDGFTAFKGVKRRFTKTGEYKGAEIIDDYAHHPEEIKATLATARTIAEKRGSRVCAIFQPHRYSRLHHLFDDFAKSFSDADKVYITDVYAAGEQSVEGVSGSALAKKMIEEIGGAKVSFLDDPDKLPMIVRDYAREGDLFVMMGAGSISSWAGALPSKLAE